ncbi:hypothetical protein C8R43DRAFT_675631 [Mycena crocata]|nr:hypothetical protein C8R43DRAFT_675631 [Mycena crocata]
MSPSAAPKKSKAQGACDICRRQKVRCDSATMPGNRCSKCITYNSKCTHDLSQSKEGKGRRRKRIIQTSTDEDLEAARALVNDLLSGTHETPRDPDALLQLLLQVSRYAKSLEQELTTRQSGTPSVRASGSPDSDSHADDDAGIVVNIQELPDHLKALTADMANHRFFGKTGSVMFLGAAIEALQKDTVRPGHRARSKRPQFWSTLPWEISPHTEPPVVQIFPEEDLLRDLVEIYFTQHDIYLFILHRPTFEKAIADRVHLHDHRFGAVVLAVCALAAKNSPDPRVLLPGQGELSAGWKWLAQVPRPFSGPLETASLHDLQLCCLYLMLQKIGPNSETVWLLCGIGLLHARDIGAHKHPGGHKSASWTVEAELCTRICFYLAIFDAIASAWFGRPRAVTALEGELPLPAVCDDEYWVHPDPARAFTQPPGRPSRADFNLASIKLMGIYASSMRGDGRSESGAAAIAQIDARLDQWAKEIPEHLLWNPYMEDDIFFTQSASLYAIYYHVQILLHRPLLQTMINQAPSPSAFKSLAICANAARSVAHIADVWTRRGFFPHSQFMKAVFDAAVVLVLNISGGARSNLSIDTDRELVAVYKCMALLRNSERRWQNAGRFNDMLCELMHASKLPLPEHPSPEAPTTGDSNTGASEDRQDHLFSLPMAVDDLSRLPIYDSLAQMDFAAESADPQSQPQFFIPGQDNAAVAALLSLGTHADAGYAAFTNFDDIDMNNYMSEWIPYWSGASTLVHAMQSTSYTQY